MGTVKSVRRCVNLWMTTTTSMVPFHWNVGPFFKSNWSLRVRHTLSYDVSNHQEWKRGIGKNYQRHQTFYGLNLIIRLGSLPGPYPSTLRHYQSGNYRLQQTVRRENAMNMMRNGRLPSCQTNQSNSHWRVLQQKTANIHGITVESRNQKGWMTCKWFSVLFFPQDGIEKKKKNKNIPDRTNLYDKEIF